MVSQAKDVQKQAGGRVNDTAHGEGNKTQPEFKTIALKGLFVIACFYTLYFARALILPFTLALLLNFLLRPVVRVLKKIKIPELAGAALVIIALFGSAGYGVIRLSGPASEWINKVPVSLRQIESKVGFFRKPLEMAGFLVFLPYIGPLIGISVVTLVAFLTFDSLGRILLAPAIYIALETIQGQIITPMVLGLRFTLNPVVIFVWLIFWGWMWGIVGAMLAFPILTIFKILCDHIQPLAPIGEFLEK